MDKMQEYVKGTCTTMCSPEEIVLREVRGLVHFLESVHPITNNTRKQIRKGCKDMTGDPSRMVKCFQRSAAGREMPHPCQIRTIPTLQTTIHYLLNEVVCDKRLAFSCIYDFITDRLRAVRQDIVMQQPTAVECIPLLEPMVRFHAYSAYRLCDAMEFDSVLNHQHLMTCLKWLLNLYDSIDHVSEERIEMEALYILINLGNINALLRSFGLRNEIRQGIVLDAEKISRAWCLHNYYTVLKNVENLPALLGLTLVATQLAYIRRYALMVMNSAYSSTNSKYPLSNLMELLLYNSIEEISVECQAYGLKVENETSISFLKGTFKADQTKPNIQKVGCIDVKISTLPLPELLLTSCVN